MIVGERNAKAIRIAWIILGLVFAFSFTSYFLCGNGSIYKFYNVGEVYEVADVVYNTYSQQENGHQELSGKVILDNGEYAYTVVIEDNDSEWKYFCFDLDNIHAANLQIVTKFMTIENGAIVGQKECVCDLKEGMNVISVPQNPFAYIDIYIEGEPGDSFYVKGMQLRESAPVFTWGAAIKLFLMIYAIYSLVVCALLFICRKRGLKCRLYRWIEVLQELYISVAERLYESVSKIPWLMNGRRCLRTFLFAVMFVYNAVVEMQGTYKTKFKYHLLVYALLILLITVLTITPKLRKQNWNNMLAWSWLVLWGIACISDFLVPKNYRYLGYMMILMVGFFFFVWNNMENRYEIIEDFIRGIHIFMGFVVAFCFLFRTDVEGMRYSGISDNPSIFAIYLGVIWAVVLGEVEQKLREQKPVIRMMPYIAEGCVTVAFCWKAQAIGPMLYMLITAFVCFLRVICYTKRTRTQRKTVLVAILFFLVFLPIYMATDWGINHVPQILGKPIVFEKDHPEAYRELGMVVRAAEDIVAADSEYSTDVAETGSILDRFSETRIGQKLINMSASNLLSGRDYYYRQYLRNMNLFGHEKNPTLWGHRRLPHNALIGIAYRYGVFAVVPYILMLGAVLVRTFRYGNKNVKYAGMPFLICLISILMSMTDNVEQPFVWLPWIALYLMMGIVFADEEQSEQEHEFTRQEVLEMGGNG